MLAVRALPFDPAVFGGRPEAPPVPVVICWEDLGPEEYGRTLGELAKWLAWLRRTYRIPATVFPPCWYAHGDLLEELSALHTAHQGAYHPDGAATGPADWHHQLAATRTRLNASVARTGCRPGEHRPAAPPAWAADPPPEGYATGLAGHITADLATRP